MHLEYMKFCKAPCLNRNRRGSNLTFETGLIVKRHVIKDIRSVTFFFSREPDNFGRSLLFANFSLNGGSECVLNAVFLCQNFFY